MTVTSSDKATGGAEVQPNADLVSVTIDGFEISVPKGTLLIRAAELLGIEVPRFCDHPLLDPVGACRQCLVEVTDMGNGRGMPKPAASCTTTVMPGMVIKTQLTSAVADKAQKGVMELLLINHPLDCPVCDKGGECPLQNQAMSNGRATSRFEGVKRTYPKPVPISAQVLLDRERCVLCARCTRFSAQVAGDPFIEMLERGALQQVGIYAEKPFESYFSGNTVQICPVGALTGTAYRFRSRPFDLVSTPMTCEHCASGCSLRADHRRGAVLRRLAGDDPEVNEEWNCDKGRWAFQYAVAQDRLTAPLVRNAAGELVPTSWPDALDVAAQGLAKAAAAGGVGVLPGGRLTLEDSYAYSKFTRLVLGTHDVDFRARPHSVEEAAFLSSVVAGTRPGNGGVTYAELEQAPAVLLVGFEPEEESPIVFLRLRKATRRAAMHVVAVAPLLSRGVDKLGGELLRTVPGAEAAALDELVTDPSRISAQAAAALREPGAIVLVGERLAQSPGALTSAQSLATAFGARLAWVPRRAGERGALDAGLLPTLLPGGRQVSDPAARVDVATVWGAGSLPTTPGRDLTAILAAVTEGSLDALLVGAVDPDDLPDPAAALAALDAARFVVSLELRPSAVTERADVVLPIAAAVEKAGTYVDWEGRPRPFDAVLRSSSVATQMTTNALTDGRVLHVLAQELGIDLGLPDVAAARSELAELGEWEGERAHSPQVSARPPIASVPAGHAVLATWHQLLDEGTLQAGEPYLAATAKRSVCRLSPVTAEGIDAHDGDLVTISTERGEIALPLVVTEMVNGVVWLPTNSAASDVRRSLAAAPGDVVAIRTTPLSEAAASGSTVEGTSS